MSLFDFYYGLNDVNNIFYYWMFIVGQEVEVLVGSQPGLPVVTVFQLIFRILIRFYTTC